MTAMLQEIYAYIDDMPESKLEALRQFLRAFMNDPLIIETDLTDEEREIVKKSREHYMTHPEDFILLEDIT